MLKAKSSGGIKRFFYETFRAHSRDEYSEFLTRKGEGGYKAYPFVWVRVLAAELIVFAIALIVSEFTGYSTFYSYSVFIGGILMNLPVFVLIYELYPDRDLSFLKYFFAFFIGGAAAIAGSLLAYYAYEPENEWLSALWTGFIEELFKAVPAIIFIAACKNKKPLFGFLIGAAVGAGVSVIEDMAYIHGNAGAWGFWSENWRKLIEITVGRGLTAVCTHTVWTALIGWAYCKFKKPFMNFRFYLIAVWCIALHFCWDMPVEWWVSLLIYFAVAAQVLAISIVIFKRERKKTLGVETSTARQLALEEVAAA